MAFKPQIIPRTDFYPNIGVGVGIPFSNGAVFTTTYTSQASTKNNLLNFLITEPGERYDNPTFGFGFRKYLFLQIEQDSLDFIQDDVANAIGQYFPQITVNDLQVTADANTQTIEIKLYYSIKNQSINDQLEITFG
jgi:phage baseplate assembly protein W